MPELDFRIVDVETSSSGIVPLLLFKLAITTAHDGPIQALLLNAQIQIESPKRPYSAAEKEKLVELFGTPDRWGQTLRNRLWTHTNATVGNFTRETKSVLPVPCTYDLNFAAPKYFCALDGGEVSLLFLFSGSVFYVSSEGRLQVERISWNKECLYRLPVQVWKDLMEQHYPNSAWLYLRRDAFERLWAYRRQNGLATWEQTIERLLPTAEERAAAEQAQAVVV